MTRPITLPGRIGELARVFPKGVTGLAKHFRVHRSTINRWASKGQAEGPAQVLLEELMASYLTTPETAPACVSCGARPATKKRGACPIHPTKQRNA